MTSMSRLLAMTVRRVSPPFRRASMRCCPPRAHGDAAPPPRGPGCPPARFRVAAMCGPARAAILRHVAPRCLIVDDNAGFRDAARSLLEREAIEVVGVASNSAEAHAHVAELRPDVVLVDIDLGAESGFELARALARRATRG